MCERLEIRIIAASSPQAKGRVERNNGVHQDRLVKKLRRQGIASYEGKAAPTRATLDKCAQESDRYQGLTFPTIGVRKVARSICDRASETISDFRFLTFCDSMFF